MVWIIICTSQNNLVSYGLLSFHEANRGTGILQVAINMPVFLRYRSLSETLSD